MTPFNPPRKQATVALADATRTLAMNALSEVRRNRSIEPGHRPLRKNDIGRNSQGIWYVALLHQVLDAVGIEGRKVLTKRATHMDDICSVELTSNTADHWSIVYRFMVFHNDEAVVGAVAIHHLYGKMEVDFYVDKDRWVEPVTSETTTKNLTVKQLELGYLKYLRLGSVFLEFRHAVWNTGSDMSSIVCVLCGLDIRSLGALVAKANEGAEDYDGLAPEPRFILHINRKEMVTRPGLDDSPSWDLVDIVPHGHVRLYRNRPALDVSAFNEAAILRRQAEGHLRFGEILMQIADQKEST